jgi:hypothetical protein
MKFPDLIDLVGLRAARKFQDDALNNSTAESFEALMKIVKRFNC